MNKWKRGLKRITAIVVAAILVGTTVDMSAFTVYAEESMQSGLCEHHTEHTYECGHKEAVEGEPCTFVCDVCESEKKETPACKGEGMVTVYAASNTFTVDNLKYQILTEPVGENPGTVSLIDYTTALTGNVNIRGEVSDGTNIYAVTSIGNSAFDKCLNLEKVTIDKSVTTIGAGAFDSCLFLEEVTIGNSVTSIGEKAFYNCSDLTSVTIPASVKSIGVRAFGNCSDLTAINVEPENAVYASVDGILFTKDRTALVSFPVGNDEVKNDKAYTIPDGVKSISEYAFNEGGYYLWSITIPDSVESIGAGAFYNCSSLESVTIPNSVTSIGNDAFISCSGLTEITISDSVTSIGEGVFCLCSNLTSVTIPASVTSIGNQAFYNCGDLTSVTIPNSVTSIGNQAFARCPNLYVHYLGTEEQWNTTVKVSSDALTNTKGTHYVVPTSDAGGSTHSWCCPEEGCGAVLKTEDHTWDAGVVTKEATTTEKGVKTYTCSACKTTKVEEIPVIATKPGENTQSGDTTEPTGYDTAEKTEKTITTANTDKGDVKGSTFVALQLKAVGNNKSVKLTWKKVKDADGYILYAAQCGKKLKKLKTFTGASKVEYTHKKLKNAKYYKYMVVAYKTINGKKYTIATSKSAHAVTNGGKYANPTKVTVKASKLSIKKGAKKTIKASYKLPKNKKVKVHIAKFRYESDNPKVATVTNKGVVKGKKKGTANIYVYAQNGVYKKVKVTVK